MATFTRRSFLELTGALALGETANCSRKTSNQESAKLVKAERFEDPNDVSLFVCGDVMTGRGIDQVLPNPSVPRLYEPAIDDARAYVELAERLNGEIEKPVSYTYIWGDALTELELRAPHLRIINLETSITTSSSPLPKGINYRMHPKNVPCLTHAGIDCAILANNHVLDWEEPGLLETLAVLRRSGIKYAGAGENDREASAPAIFRINSACRVLVFAFAAETSGVPQSWAALPRKPGVHYLSDLAESTLSRIQALVRAFKGPSDIAVASIHWGSNWGYRIPDTHREFAHALIDKAAIDILHGHSSHHPRGIEVYHNKLILYGCGDFLNDYEGIEGYENYRSDLTIMYFVRVSSARGELSLLELVPLQLRRFSLHHASASDVDWLATVLDRESAKLETRIARTDSGSLIVRPNDG